MYRVICAFADITDNNHVYSVGDEFPRDGAVVSDARLKELSTTANRIGKPLIDKVVVRRRKKE